MRCVHLNRIGEQCRDQALEGKDFCAYHCRILEGEEPEEKSPFPLIYRLAALALLLIFLISAYQRVRTWLGY